jgi:putative oxidoreductase
MALSRFSSYAQGLLRIVASFLFACHGAQKLFGLFGGRRMELASMTGVAGILEFGGGLLLLAGVAPRIVALILSGEMAVAYFYVHARRGLWPIQNGGELAALYCFLFLFIAAAGPGAWSIHRR